MPLVPDLALYTSSARLRKGSWPAGDLVQRTLGFSGYNVGEIEKTWKRIFDALTVDRTDDVWARFIAEELDTWRPPRISHEWEYAGLGDVMAISHEDANAIQSPAKCFHEDLDAVLRLKPYLTRRQWISMLESILRIGTASHVLWICHAHEVVWRSCNDALPDRLQVPKPSTGIYPSPPMGSGHMVIRPYPRPST